MLAQLAMLEVEPAELLRAPYHPVDAAAKTRPGAERTYPQNPGGGRVCAEAEVALGLPPGFHSYALLPIGYPVGRSGQSAVSLSPMWFTKIGGAHVIGIKNASLRLNAAALGLWRATKLSIRALF
jgi:hypothetical protein